MSEWKVQRLVVSAALALGLGGCTTGMFAGNMPTETVVHSPEVSDVERNYIPPALPNESSRYVYEAMSAQLTVYDTNVQEVLLASDVANDFYYGFNNFDALITAGNSYTLGFQLLKVSGDEVASLLTLPPTQGLFPLASAGGLRVFTLSTFDGPFTEIERRIVLWDEGSAKLYPVGDITGIVAGGAIVGGELYYTTLIADRNYSLHVVNLGDDTALPTLVEQQLPYPDIFSFGGSLLRRVDQTWVGAVFGEQPDAMRWECPVTCYFFDEADLVLSINAGSDGVANGVVYDAIDHTVVTTVTGVVGAAMTENGLEVYGWHDMAVGLRGSRGL